MHIRSASPSDADSIWSVIAPAIRAGETYALPADWDRAEALAYWCARHHAVFVAEEDGRIVGTYFLQANQQGGGSHVANCGYMVLPEAAGRGIASAMARHSLVQAAEAGFSAMQFNFVVGTNARAIALWHRFGFAIVGTLPGAFRHPTLGIVDALIMHRHL